ncbi:MAG: agmatine deiminase family protein [Bacteroidota bacterium]|nr:agmatine deiminase family protein [Bacteroidota bacterium]MDX5431588.1 agmatine deiminase family protein [Bacteroidota bacterium]MDX5470308.1 agmatine deiminase family protein [Bacteroidota bacterium]
MPPEYSPQRAVCVGYDAYFQKEFLSICRALAGQGEVVVLCSSLDSKSFIFQLLHSNDIDTANFSVLPVRNHRIWIRDHGPTFCKSPQDSLFVADFNWNMYGAFYWLESKYHGDSLRAKQLYQGFRPDKIGRIDAEIGKHFKARSIPTDVIMEGGSIEVNGTGTLILSEEVTFNRNPTLSKPYIENELNRVLGTNEVLWLEQGLVEDPHWFQNIHENYFGFGTFGHTDEFVRFANDSTLLLAWVDEKEKDLNYFNQENYRRMSRNLEIINQFKRKNGNKFHVIKVPIPNLIYTTAIVSTSTNYFDTASTQTIDSNQFPQFGMKNLGDSIQWVAASSYLNYLVTDKIILLPDYAQVSGNEAKQETVLKIFSELFPDRKIVFVDVMKLNFFGGGIHCVTQQIPK